MWPVVWQGVKTTHGQRVAVPHGPGFSESTPPITVKARNLLNEVFVAPCMVPMMVGCENGCELDSLLLDGPHDGVWLHRVHDCGLSTRLVHQQVHVVVLKSGQDSDLHLSLMHNRLATVISSKFNVFQSGSSKITSDKAFDKDVGEAYDDNGQGALT